MNDAKNVNPVTMATSASHANVRPPIRTIISPTLAELTPVPTNLCVNARRDTLKTFIMYVWIQIVKLMITVNVRNVGEVFNYNPIYA